ncbi:hypothetical protein CTAYLR_003601 [Chrysophaeum taylorii]|uniref:Phytanoyl-CoA dioxygenase n=1 Tax=Chrysophaeum taylorii TaxID=2483200 RepID=A0AAD7XQG5_9STRA|nr:hypothetical protein CTAYLR_003601 [Chrysophaeum taylorii]
MRAFFVLALGLVVAWAFVPVGDQAVRRRGGVVVEGIDVNVWDYVWDRQDPKVALPEGVTEDSDPAPFTITQEQIATLKRDGVVHIPGVLTPEWLAHIRALTDHQVSHPHVWASPGVASGLYDYVQRNVWTTNDGFMKFLYHSPVSSVLAHLGEAKTSVRLTTDLLMVNPNKGFKWHQDNQNGPVGFDDALRWWVTMDDTPRDYGAPVYLRRSHENEFVDDEAVFVSLDQGDLPKYADDMLEFRPKAGDMIVWHARTIHKIDGPESQDWGDRRRRVLGGTVAIDDANYKDKQKVEFADMGRHQLKDGDPLTDPHFPRIWPRPVPEEKVARFQGAVGRSVPGFARMLGALFSYKTIQQFGSWGNVVKIEKPTAADDDVKSAATAPARSR